MPESQTARCFLVFFAGLLAAASESAVRAQVSYEAEPIRYFEGPLDNPLSRLHDQAADGQLRLERTARFGYLPNLLAALGIDPASQVLVFSKTSFQLRQISPETPRAIYFNDDIYVGYVAGGDVLEVSVADAQQGAVFYTVGQAAAPHMEVVRRTHECLQCHSSSVTQGVPGHVVRSVFPDQEGHPVLRAGSFVTTHASPLSERWGGWYVTGTHGSQRHMGNTIISRDADAEQFDREAGANVTELSGRFDASRYLSPHSDLVALMVLEHQTHVHNLLTAANYQARMALHDQQIMDEMLERTGSGPSDSTLRRVGNAAEKLVEGLLFSGEATLEAPLKGTSAFAERFTARGPRDTQGRSLRQFDLERRMFQYPCSYLVYTAAFDCLPPIMKAAVYRRLDEVLTAAEPGTKYAHLSPVDRQSIREILIDTKPDFAQAIEKHRG